MGQRGTHSVSLQVFRSGFQKRVGRLALYALPLLFLSVFFYGPLIQVISRGFSLDQLSKIFSSPYMRHVLFFTLEQALLSMLASLFLGVGLAFVLAKYEFPGRRWLKSLTIVPFALPPVAVALGFVLIYGKNGALNQLLMGLLNLGEPPIQILYSLPGIILAHAFYNAPIVARFVAASWERLPVRYEESALSLGAPRWRVFLKVTLPLLMPGLISGATLAFIFSFLSFPAVLAIGGSQFSTLEVEIYRRAIIQIDYSGAAALAAVALFFSLLSIFVYLQADRPYRKRLHIVATQRRTQIFKNIKSLIQPRYLLLNLFMTGMLIFFAAPLAGILIDSLTRQSHGQMSLTLDWYGQIFSSKYSALIAASPLQSVLNSLTFALSAMMIALLFGTILTLLMLRRRTRGQAALELLLMAPLAASPVAFGLALLWASAQPPINMSGAGAVIVIAHSILAVPFVIRAMMPALAQFDSKLYEAASALGASHLHNSLKIVFPLIRGSLATGAAFAFAISIAEMSATIMLAQPDLLTMPLSVYYLLSSRQTGAASAMCVMMILVLIFAFVVIDRRSEPSYTNQRIIEP